MLFLLYIGCIYCLGTSVGSSCEGAQGLGRNSSASGQAYPRSNTLKSNSQLEWQINRSRSKLMPNLEEPCSFERGSRISSHVWIDSEKVGCYKKDPEVTHTSYEVPYANRMVLAILRFLLLCLCSLLSLSI
uniref:Putative secreted protein n=1 Tax=Rhipicephalus microplus TaxID=6941 RepID=A0A6G5A0P2_RHIMP